MSPALFRKVVRWIGMLVLAHIVGWIIYNMLFADTVASLIADGDRAAIRIMVVYNIIYDALFVAFCLKFNLSYDDKNLGKEIKEDVRSNSFSVIGYFKTQMLREHLFKLGVFALFQIPHVILLSVFRLSLPFYAMDVGCYMVVGYSPFGWLLNTLMFAVIFTLVVLLYLLIVKKDVQKNMMI